MYNLIRHADFTFWYLSKLLFDDCQSHLRRCYVIRIVDTFQVDVWHWNFLKLNGTLDRFLFLWQYDWPSWIVRILLVFLNLEKKIRRSPLSEKYSVLICLNDRRTTKRVRNVTNGLRTNLSSKRMNRCRCSTNRWYDCSGDFSAQSRRFSARICCRPRNCWIWDLRVSGVRCCANNTFPEKPKTDETVMQKNLKNKILTFVDQHR